MPLRERPTSGSSAPVRGWWGWQLLAALLAVALYARTVGFGWAFDDQMEIVRNTFVHSWQDVGRIFTSTVWAGSGMETYLYRPLASLTYLMNHTVSGLEAWSYHLVNVLLHALASVLVFRLGRLWGLPAAAAGLGATLFAAHPLHVEVVANVAGRKDLLAAVMVLGMALTHRTAVGRGGWRAALPVALYAGAVLSKEVGVVGLALVAVQDLFLEAHPRRFFGGRRVVGLYFGYLAVLAAFFLVRTAVTGTLGVPETSPLDNPLVAVSLPARIATALVILGKGLLLHVVPAPLSPDYSYDAIPVVSAAGDLRLLAALASLVALAWLTTRGSGRRHAAPVAAAWYVLAVLPASNLLIQVGTVFGERLLYLPSVATCLLGGVGAAWLLERGRGAGPALALAVVAALSLQAWRYSGAWRDDVALFRWATVSVPTSTKAHHKLGEELLRQGELGGALRSLNRAVRIAPANSFAAATLRQAQERAVQRYGAQGAPDGDALPRDADVLHALGQARQAVGDPTAAARLWEAALAVDSAHALTLGDLGAARLDHGDTTGALALLEKAVHTDPGQAPAWYNLARIHLEQGHRGEALDALRRFVAAAGGAYPAQVRWAESILLGGS